MCGCATWSDTFGVMRVNSMAIGLALAGSVGGFYGLEFGVCSIVVVYLALTHEFKSLRSVIYKISNQIFGKVQPAV